MKYPSDLTGIRFGRLVVLGEDEPRYKLGSDGYNHKQTMWSCLCDCGSVKTISRMSLCYGNCNSCGCLNKEKLHQRKKSLVGETFGTLTVVSEDESKNNYYLCKCSCENTNLVSVSASNLRSGGVLSCGCLKGKSNKKYNTYDLYGNYGIGHDCNNKEFYFDLEDYDKIKNYCWYIDDKNYVKTTFKGTTLKFHKVITTYVLVDHINRNTVDNRKENLRDATYQENARNSSLAKNNKSGYTGVSWSKTMSKWESVIMVDRKRKVLGYFNNKEDAVKIRLQAEKEYFGEFSPQRHLFEEYGV